MKYSRADVIGELVRELEMRRTLYKRWVQIRRLDKDVAAFRIRCIENAIQRLEGRSATQKISFTDLIDELNREIRMRQDVYPRLIQKGKLHERVAFRRISLFQAAIAMLCGEEVATDPDQQMQLFKNQ